MGGTTEKYKQRILYASDVYKNFASKWGHYEPRMRWVGTISFFEPYLIGVDVGLQDVPKTTVPAVETLTRMMSEIVAWQTASIYLSCEGEGCPKDNKSDNFQTPFAYKLCYVDAGGKHCFDNSMFFGIDTLPRK